MNSVGGTIPTRFLVLLANFSILIILLWDKDENLRRCSLYYDPEWASFYQQEYILTVSLSLSFLVVELFGFLSGVSMFSALHCIFSSICHCMAAFAWSVSYIDNWDCTFPFYWFIFGFCSILPFMLECITFVRFLRNSRR